MLSFQDNAFFKLSRTINMPKINPEDILKTETESEAINFIQNYRKEGDLTVKFLGINFFHFAIQKNYKELIALLLELAPDINDIEKPIALTSSGATPMHSAAISGNIEVAEIIYAQVPADKQLNYKNAVNSNGLTALHLAVTENGVNDQFIKWLLDKGFSQNIMHDAYKATPLMLAIFKYAKYFEESNPLMHEELNVIQLFLDAIEQPSLELKNWKDHDLIQHTLMYDIKPVKKLLQLKYPDYFEKNKKTLKRIEVFGEWERSVKKAGRPLPAPASENLEPLLRGYIDEGNKASIEETRQFIIASGVAFVEERFLMAIYDVSEKEKNKKSCFNEPVTPKKDPITLAVSIENKNFKLIKKLLVAEGSNFNFMLPNFGKSLLEYAIENKCNFEILKFLIEADKKNIQIRKKNNEGLLPIITSVYNKDLNLYYLLKDKGCSIEVELDHGNVPKDFFEKFVIFYCEYRQKQLLNDLTSLNNSSSSGFSEEILINKLSCLQNLKKFESKLVRTMLEKNNDFDVDAEGNDRLMRAISAENLEFAKLLVQASHFTLKQKNKKGQTAGIIILKMRSLCKRRVLLFKELYSLLELMYPLKEIYREHQNVFNCAIDVWDADVIRSVEVDWASFEYSGDTILHKAISHRDNQLIKHFSKVEELLCIKNNDGLTPYDLAKVYLKDEKMISSLKYQEPEVLEAEVETQEAELEEIKEHGKELLQPDYSFGYPEGVDIPNESGERKAVKDGIYEYYFGDFTETLFGVKVDRGEVVANWSRNSEHQKSLHVLDVELDVLGSQSLNFGMLEELNKDGLTMDVSHITKWFLSETTLSLTLNDSIYRVNHQDFEKGLPQVPKFLEQDQALYKEELPNGELVCFQVSYENNSYTLIVTSSDVQVPVSVIEHLSLENEENFAILKIVLNEETHYFGLPVDAVKWGMLSDEQGSSCNLSPEAEPFQPSVVSAQPIYRPSFFPVAAAAVVTQSWVVYVDPFGNQIYQPTFINTSLVNSPFGM